MENMSLKDTEFSNLVLSAFSPRRSPLGARRGACKRSGYTGIDIWLKREEAKPTNRRSAATTKRREERSDEPENQLIAPPPALSGKARAGVHISAKILI